MSVLRLRPEGVHPPLVYPAYASTTSRGPRQPLVALDPGDDELRVASARGVRLGSHDADLTRQSSGAPIGERIVVAGRVLDEDGAPVRDSLVEVWQCNAAGRYHHAKDQHDAPLDPNFQGFGKLLTDAQGNYRFVTIKPAPYPWGNHRSAWRPAHIHFSLFGNAYAQRLITQMYFPGDPLLPLDPIFNSVPQGARDRLVSAFDLDLGMEGISLGYRFDIVLRGRGSTPFGI
jgi:protocatechuate 3,4-dioxygenase beta subunit